MSQPPAPASVYVLRNPATTNIERIFDAALKSYEKKTKNNLKDHDIFKQLESCDSPAEILTKFLAAQFDDPSRTGSDDKLKKWLVPTLNVLCAFSNTLGEGVSLAFPPAKAVFAGGGVLLSAAKDVIGSQDTLIDIFERIESFFVRLEIYTGVPLTPKMTNKMVQITVEILDILAIATKEMKQSRGKKFLKRVIGRTDLEDGMKKLDKLTNEEVVMASAQLLKVTHKIDNNVTEVNEGVRRVNENVVVVKGGVQFANDNIKAVYDKVQTIADDGVDNKQKQLRENLRKWQSPPDTFTNHNIAGGRRQEGTAKWFIDGDKFRKWMEAGALFWIHGKPGSGKSILCSAIINDVMKRKARMSSVAFFYFDFRDENKKSLRNLLSSLLVQLSNCSNAFCDVLSRCYVEHDNGARPASDTDMTKCLKEMLTLPYQGPVYLIMDALDECPDTYDVPSARERVLDLVKELVSLHLPGLHICITSRPEVNISEALVPLASQTVSLQDETGQRKDIADYVRSVVYSGLGTFMRQWRKDDKEHVIETLSERADGMFRWVFCQLEILRNCLPQNVRRVLQELPASLDETYERMLGEILKANPDQAYRLLQCLTVATRPLRVDELAEILALDFNNAKDGIPMLNGDWRWDDEQQGVLATCSSLIVVVEGNDYYGKTRVVQFAHFSVKEFLTSGRLADIKADISRFHIRLEPAHTTIAQSCLAILLQSDQDGGANSTSALYEYAAQHWVDHAHIGDVSLGIKDGMRRLFDPAKPFFTTWRNSCGLDIKWSSFLENGYSLLSQRPKSTSLGEDDVPLCLYYAALCGFRDLTRYFIDLYPQHINATVGENGSPVVAALRNGHIHVAGLLHQHGAALPFGIYGRTLLHAASADGMVDVAQWLLDISADANAREDAGHTTPLYFAAASGRLETVQILLCHSVDVNATADYDAPLHGASSGGYAHIVRLLIEYGADVHARNQSQSTPLHLARGAEIVKLLIEHGADVHVRDQSQSTPLHLAWGAETVKLLIEHGADVHARDQSQSTPLHLARGAKTVKLLIENGADVHVRDQRQSTPLHNASSNGYADAVQLLIKHGADVHARDKCQSTPLHQASSASTMQVLIKHGVDVHARPGDQIQSTPLYHASSAETVQLLVKHGADVHTQDQSQSTALFQTSSAKTVKLLIKHGADVHARDQNQQTPLHIARHPETVQLLIKHGADVHARDQSRQTPLHLAHDAEAVQQLIKHGADIHARDQSQSTPLHLAQNAETVQQLIKHGADIHAREQFQSTPLHLAQNAETVQQLIKHGADTHARDQFQSTPLHLAQNAETVQLLIKHGADIHARDQFQSTPLHLARNAEIVQLLIKHGADIHARDQFQSTPLHLAQSAETVQLLIKHGVDIHARDQFQSTPLHLARNAEIVQLLIKHGADIHARDYWQLTPLSRAWNPKASQLLIEHGADVHTRGKDQLTPLHRPLNYETALVLIKHGADVHARDQSQSTPLHHASSENGDTEIALLLIKHGADIDARNQDQSTPLHMASSFPCWTNKQTARLLIEHGASVNAYDKNHKTPLHCLSACEYPYADFVHLLLENGADVDVVDDNGSTPFQIASANGHHEIAQLLLDHRARIVSETNSVLD